MPRIAASDDVSGPVTFDAGDVWILLPQTWRTWEELKLRAVLLHEMAHVKRRDSDSLLLAVFATCLFWFHPLSWFLRRQLSALAEEACDEIVLASGTAPERYAHFLVDFAEDVKRGRGRVVAAAIAVTGRSLLKRRIERLFVDARHRQRGRKLIAGLALILFVPALYLTAAARFGERQEQQNAEQASIPWPRWDQIVSLSPADATMLEAAVRAQPEDLNSRMELLVYCAWKDQGLEFTDQLLWFIKHHPQTESLQMAEGMFRDATALSGASREQIKGAWEKAMAEHADSPVVLFNAASWLTRNDPERGLPILRKAEALEAREKREQYYFAIAAVYAAAEMEDVVPGSGLNNIQMSDDAGGRLRGELKDSGDPALLSETGRILVRMHPPLGADKLFQRGLELIRQAVRLDPGNARWTEALEAAEAEPQRKQNYDHLVGQAPMRQGVVRIGSKVAEANLISKTDPVYPPFARTARLQGIVEFSVTVGVEGKISAIQLVHGDALFVAAAKEAVSRWVYHAATVDGQAIPFMTEVIVPFRLDQ